MECTVGGGGGGGRTNRRERGKLLRKKEKNRNEKHFAASLTSLCCYFRVFYIERREFSFNSLRGERAREEGKSWRKKKKRENF
jgi:hypothetical protein